MLRKPGRLDKLAFCVPENEKGSIWKYIDFTKYVLMLSSGSLNVVNALLFKDRFEGSWPRKVLEFTEKAAKNAFDTLHSSIIGENPDNEEFLRPTDEILKTIEQTRSIDRGYVYISCWHMAEKESAAMWKLYGGEGKAIAIKSTFEKLDREVAATLNEDGHYFDSSCIGTVKYIDFEMEEDLTYVMSPNRYFIKRDSYEHEKEVRVVLTKYSGKTRFKAFGVKVNLNNLIDLVRIYPGEDESFVELVKNVTSQYGYHFKIEQTVLDKEPLF